MDDNEHQWCQDGDVSSLSKISSCGPPIILIEPTTSTLNPPSDCEKHCPFLIHLPKHLLFTITAHLDLVSRICLQSVNRHFRNSIDVDLASLNLCARLALARHGGDVSKSVPPSVRALCKSSQCIKLFENLPLHFEQPQHGTSKRIMRLLGSFPWARPYIAQDMEKK